MIVPKVYWNKQDIDPLAGCYHSGCIGHEVEHEPDREPRRSIGFRMPEPEPEPPHDPSWMLL